MVACAAGISEPMVRRGIKELRGRATEASKRVRKQGGGRKRLEQVDPALVVDLEKLISPDTRGDPESPLRWTCKSLRQLSAALAGMGHAASPKVSQAAHGNEEHWERVLGWLDAYLNAG